MMARSPLIHLVKQAYKLALLSRKMGIPAGELIDIVQENLSRRRLLYGGLALGGAFAGVSASCAHQATVAATEKVLIVGAGIAGLSAAYRLNQAGVPVDIIESRNSVGGRMRSLSNALGTPKTIELGGEFIDTDHVTLQKLAQELGLKQVDILAAQSGLISNTYFFQGQRISLEDIISYFEPIAPLIAKDADAANQSNVALARLDQLSIHEYLTTDLTRRGVEIHPILLSLLEVAYTGEYGLSVNQQSSLNLIFLIGTTATVTDFSLFGDSDQRFQIVGGNQQIPLRLAQQLASLIQVSTALEALRQRSDGRYQVSLRSGSQSFERTYERVLLTLPFSVLRRIPLQIDLPPLKRQAIHQLGYGTNAKLITAYSDRRWRTQYGSTASVYSDLGFQNTWEASPYTTDPSGIVTDFTGGDYGLSLGTGSSEFQAQRFLKQFEMVFPGVSQVRQGGAVRALWPTEPDSRGSYACYQVGQWTKFYIQGVEGQRVGNLFFAGEHTSQDFQGYMEGGCETGERAAQQILQDLGIKMGKGVQGGVRMSRKSPQNP